MFIPRRGRRRVPLMQLGRHKGHKLLRPTSRKQRAGI